MKRKPQIPKTLFMTHGEVVRKIIDKAVQDALRMHKKLGNSVATWERGRVVIVPPEQIPVDESDKKSVQPKRK